MKIDFYNHQSNHRIKSGRLSGLTLLEVVLALALTVLLFAAIANAIRVNLTGLANQQTRIERKQIARSILAMIGNDCRAGVQYKAADFSGLDNLIKSQQMMMSDALGLTGANSSGTGTGGTGTGGTGTGGTGAGQPGTGNNAGQGQAGNGANQNGSGGQTGTATQGGTQGGTGTQGGQGAQGGLGTQGGSSNTGSGASAGNNQSANNQESTEEEEPVYDEEAVSFRPALIGTSNSLMIDISRIPRLDQYNPLTASAASLLQSPSDVKSIAYFFSDADGGVQSSVQFDTGARGGLYRREVDRAVAAYSGETGTINSPDNFTRLVSPEVAEVEFRYYDGSSWTSSWDSAENGGFPLAIEATIVIDPARTSRNNLTYSYRGFDRQTMEVFRTVVHLPLSEIMPEEDESESGSADSSSGNAKSSSGSGGTGSGTGTGTGTGGSR